MKKPIQRLALSVCALLMPVLAQAQAQTPAGSVVLFGAVDAGIAYAVAARMNNAATTRFGVAFPSTTAVAGQGQTALAVGVRHTF